MRVRVNQSVCRGHGVCSGLSPDIFFFDANERSYVKDEHIEPGRQEDVRAAADNCPEQAIDVFED